MTVPVNESIARDFEQLRVVETKSGAELFRLAWDPRPYSGYLAAPAISPNGRRVALTHDNHLEIYEIP
jgi:hypothetical protein